MAKKILFVCTVNRLRSKTAEDLLKKDPRFEVKSAGVDKEATTPLTKELLEWADCIFVMEKRHRNIIHKKYPDVYKSKKIICLYIDDIYDYMDPVLVDLLKEKFSTLL
ncbi:phosphotyrosine protein phosphatase [Candidatus Woesearchaeota archaeon]|nr:phosphotyrosine protein phosphatase [Candidatus Woesearchaeota archaeon]